MMTLHNRTAPPQTMAPTYEHLSSDDLRHRMMDEFLELLEMMQDELQEWKSIPDAFDHEHYLIAGPSPSPASSPYLDSSYDEQPAITTSASNINCPWPALPGAKKRKRVAEHPPADDPRGATAHHTKSEAEDEERKATPKRIRASTGEEEEEREEEVAGQRQSVPDSTI